MSDLISRQDALAVIRTRLQDFAAYGNEEYRRGLYACEDIIISLSSADRPTGHIVTSGIYPTVWAECSECGKPIDAWDEFCRHCGAKMEVSRRDK